MKPKYTYVVVHVTYDHYRFEENVAADISLPAARHKAKDYGREKGIDFYIAETLEDSIHQDHREANHIYIQKIKL